LAGRTVTNGVAPGNAYDLTAGGNVAIDGIVSVGGRLNLGAGGALNLNAAGVQDSQRSHPAARRFRRGAFHDRPGRAALHPLE
jgi:hypothetical protein